MNQQVCNEYKIIEVWRLFLLLPTAHPLSLMPGGGVTTLAGDASDSENWKKLTCVRLPSAADSEILAQSILYIFTVVCC